MKAIILAAGQGSRLKDLTMNKPKCMVEYQGKPIIRYLLDVFKSCKLNDISIIAGYKHNILSSYTKDHNIRYYLNNDFAITNMVYTLFCAREELTGDIIISYSDIIYKQEVLESLINSEAGISVVVDLKWKELWLQRMEDPLKDAETLKIDDNNNIIELGKKPRSYADIQGQYIGLIKISANTVDKVVAFYNTLDKSAIYDGKNFNNMFMTSFIQLIIDNLMPVKAVFTSGGWLEVDQPSDLHTTML